MTETQHTLHKQKIESGEFEKNAKTHIPGRLGQICPICNHQSVGKYPHCLKCGHLHEVVKEMVAKLPEEEAPPQPESKPTEPTGWFNPAFDTTTPIRTQKAKGIAQLSRASLVPVGVFSPRILPCIIVQSPLKRTDAALRTVLSGLWASARLREPHGDSENPFRLRALFIRPCPTTPQHGFEASVPWYAGDCKAATVTEASKAAIDAINKVFARAVKADPQAEVVVMPLIEAASNAIAAGSVLAIGEGHDGATSGKGSYSLPMMPLQISEKLRKDSGITQTPFAEFVFPHDWTAGGQYAPFTTQLRDGPAPARGAEFIPKDMTVKQIVNAGGSLPEWAIFCQGLKDVDGVIVSHIGGNLASHYAIHCRLHNIAITTKPVVIGDELQATQDGGSCEPDRKLFEAAIRQTLLWTYNDVYEARNFILYGLHNFPAFDLTNPLHVQVLGWCVGVCVRLAIAACWGEHRHGEGYDYAKKLAHINPVSLSRGGRYNEALNARNIDKAYADISEKCQGFLFPPWDGWGCSVGGLRWMACADRSFGLWNAICDYIHGLTPLATVIECMNGVVNISHNNSKLLTKFIDINLFGLAVQHPGVVALNTSATLLKFLKAVAQAPTENDLTCSFNPVKLPSEYHGDTNGMRRYNLAKLVDYNTARGAQIEKTYNYDSDGRRRGGHDHGCIGRPLDVYEDTWIERLCTGVVFAAIKKA